MKAYLTIQQSQELLSLGVSPDKASRVVCRRIYRVQKGSPVSALPKILKAWEDCPIYDKAHVPNDITAVTFERRDIFTLTDMLGILSRKIIVKKYLRLDLEIGQCREGWFCQYIAYRHDGDIGNCKYLSKCPQLIDAVHQLLVSMLKSPTYRSQLIGNDTLSPHCP